MATGDVTDAGTQGGGDLRIRAPGLLLKFDDVAIDVIGTHRAAAGHCAGRHESPPDRRDTQSLAQSSHEASPPKGLRPVPESQALRHHITKQGNFTSRIRLHNHREEFAAYGGCLREIRAANMISQRAPHALFMTGE